MSVALLWMRILLKLLYWLAVLAMALALVVGLILWFESQDQSDIEGRRSRPGRRAPREWGGGQIQGALWIAQRSRSRAP